jgi:hypothetical protein
MERDMSTSSRQYIEIILDSRVRFGLAVLNQGRGDPEGLSSSRPGAA